MTTASKQAYLNPLNKKVRQSHRDKAKSVLFLPRTIRETATATGLKYNQVQKRMSELLADGEIRISGEKMEGGNMNSRFIVVADKKETVKKQGLTDFLKDHYPHILVEYNRRNNHKIN